MLPWLQHRWTGFWLLAAGLAALTLFLYGFFPLKYHSGKLGHMDDLPNFINDVSIDGHEVYNSGENTVVLMVIDALRYDFVTEEYMPYTGQLIKNKSACIYVSVAEPPTVTMPRIKAMMTGSVSTFADVALNFGAPAVRGDSVLRAARARGRRSVMYGDDTWLRLFPGMWAESDGTTSFYVTDYTDVDNNVTRHLDEVLTPDENKKPTFDFLVLHYLGLDHIGHQEGARSPKIKPKLLEMDEVVKKIFTAMQKWDRNGILLVCGDHGMRDAGGHGGATPAEVLVPLVVAKSQGYTCPYPSGPGPTVAQVDVAPTIAWLLNAPVPGESTGRILPSLMPQDTRQHLYLMHVLASHNAKIPSLPTDKEFFKQYLRAEAQFAHFLRTGEQSAARVARDYYAESLAAMAEHLADATVDFDMFAIGLALMLLAMIALALFWLILYSLQPEARRLSTGLQHRRQTGALLALGIIFLVFCFMQTIACFIAETKSQLCSFDSLWILAFLAIAGAFTAAYFVIKVGVEKTRDFSILKDFNTIDYLLIGGTLFHTWSFFGTSFIEEEHMTWYYYWNTLMLFVFLRTLVVVVVYVSKLEANATEVREKPVLYQRMRKTLRIVPQWVALMALHRFLRTMNQTGDRWQFLPDTADWLNAPENATCLRYLFFTGILLTVYICICNLKYSNNIMQMHTALTVAMAACIVLYRIITDDALDHDPVIIVNIFWGLIIAQFTFEILTYVGIFKSCGGYTGSRHIASDNKFSYSKPKEKTEDYFYDDSIQEPWNIEEVKLNLARSISYIMLNNLMLITTLLMRPHNVIMVPSIYFTCVLTSRCIEHTLLDKKPGRETRNADVFSQTLVHLWIGYVFFFYQGNSNSLSSVDLAAGYVGLREYSAPRVAARMGLHAYAAHAISGAALFAHLSHSAGSWPQYLQAVWRATNIFAFHRIYSVLVYCIIAAFFRHHLFVWSVFSPKLLYDFVATVFTVQALWTIVQIIGLTHVTSWIARTVTQKSRL